MMVPYEVTVRRRGPSPLTVTMLVGAYSRDAAAGLATALAEHERGGLFEAGRIRGIGAELSAFGERQVVEALGIDAQLGRGPGQRLGHPRAKGLLERGQRRVSGGLG